MNFFKALFGSSEEEVEEVKKPDEAKRFDMLKFDGLKAMRMGRWDIAVNFFTEALKAKEDEEIHEQLASAFIRMDRLDEAIEQMNLLVEKHPENIGLLYQMAHVAYMKEDYDQMKSFCQQVLEKNPEDSRAHCLFAQALVGQGDLVGGVARLTQALTYDDSNGDAHLLRGQTLYKLGNNALALMDVRWLLDHVQPHEDVLLLAARVMHAEGNDELAEKFYDTINEMNPFQLDVYRERGKIRYDKGDKKGAEEDLQKVLEQNPQLVNDISGEYSAEGIEEHVKRAYSLMNPFGL